MLRLLKAHCLPWTMFNASYSFNSPIVLIRGINCSASLGRMGVFPPDDRGRLISDLHFLAPNSVYRLDALHSSRHSREGDRPKAKKPIFSCR
jgi:hypothetical protein